MKVSVAVLEQTRTYGKMQTHSLQKQNQIQASPVHVHTPPFSLLLCPTAFLVISLGTASPNSQLIPLAAHTHESPLYVSQKLERLKINILPSIVSNEAKNYFQSFPNIFQVFVVSCHFFFSNFPHFIKQKFRTLIKNNTPNFFFYIFTLNMDFRLMYVIVYWSYQEEVIH